MGYVLLIYSFLRKPHKGPIEEMKPDKTMIIDQLLCKDHGHKQNE